MERCQGYDQAELLSLIQNLYVAQKENKTFLHTRLALGSAILEPYKDVIDRWLWPDIEKGQDFSVVKAKQAISDYWKAGNDAAGLLELKVFYCEQAIGFCEQYGFDDGPSFSTLLTMFEEALTIVGNLPVASRADFVERLIEVHDVCQDFGYGVGDAIIRYCRTGRPRTAARERLPIKYSPTPVTNALNSLLAIHCGRKKHASPQGLEAV